MMDFNNEVADLYPWLIKRARKYYSCADDIEDLVGETIYKVLCNKDKFEKGKALKPWCEVIMLNTYITEYNRKSLVSYVSCDSVKEIFSHSHATDGIIVQDILDAIKRCRLKSCSIDCVIYYARGYSYDEISKKLHIPLGTVRSRISWGREMLKKELGLFVK